MHFSKDLAVTPSSASSPATTDSNTASKGKGTQHRVSCGGPSPVLADISPNTVHTNRTAFNRHFRKTEAETVHTNLRRLSARHQLFSPTAARVRELLSRDPIATPTAGGNQVNHERSPILADRRQKENTLKSSPLRKGNSVACSKQSPLAKIASKNNASRNINRDKSERERRRSSKVLPDLVRRTISDAGANKENVLDRKGTASGSREEIRRETSQAGKRYERKDASMRGISAPSLR